MKLRLTFTFLGILFCALNSFAQTDTGFLTRAISSLERYSSTNPVEKIHLHFDKQGYMPGDTIWFKVYTVAGTDRGLSAISSIVHVELLNGKDSVINRIALPLSSGVGWGDFALPVLLKNGNYHIRAYTNWMRNFSADYFFDQPIRISETLTGILQKKQRSNTDPDVQFFPEGGFLVNGLRTKVAVKAVGISGLGENIDGSIIDGDGNEVAVFSSQHLGMGMFAIIPQAGKSYKAKITRKDGKQFTINLPKAQDDGFAIAINNSRTDSLSIRVAASAKLFDAKKGSKYYLVAQSGAKVYYTADFNLSAQSFITPIDKKRFPTGIVQFTLFAENGEPLNQRIAFIRHDDQLKLNLTPAKQAYATRQKVDITIKAFNKDSKPVLGSFSTAVINQDLTYQNKTTANSIFSSLLLTSDIKGYIEEPDYYFTDVTDKTDTDLDLLMLTQGYHRFEWKQVIDGTYPQLNFEPENELSLTGYLKTNGGKPISKGKVLLYKTKNGWFKLDTLTDQNGKFIFKGLVPDPDTTLKYIIQGRTGFNKRNLVVSIDTIAPFKENKNAPNGFIENDTIKLTAYQQQASQQLKLNLNKRIIPLKEVTIKAEKAPLNSIIMDPDQTIRDFPKEASGQKLSVFLTTRIRGVIFLNGLPYSSRIPKQPMTILLDGSVVPPELFQTINASEVEGIQVLRTTGKADPITGITNVLMITSKRGVGIYTKEEAPDVITFTSNGLYKAREFYSPKYNITSSYQQPDIRTTIYWKPNIVTDKDGNASISFFNGDMKGTYRVTVEGIDTDGNLGRVVYRYNVE